MYVRYSYVFNVGQNYHSVRVYEDRTDEMGLIGDPVETAESTRMRDVKKELRTCPHLTQIQRNRLASAMSDRLDCIIGPEGRIFNY